MFIGNKENFKECMDKIKILNPKENKTYRVSFMYMLRSLLLIIVLFKALIENLFGNICGQVYLSVNIQISRVSKGNTIIKIKIARITFLIILFFISS